MPRLNTFKVTVETGDTGTPGPVKFSINNHTLPFEDTQGGTAPGETFEGRFEVNSYAHSLTLVGPEEGRWDIRRITVDYDCDHTEPYTVNFGAVTLDDTNQVNIWQDPPLPAFEV